MINGCFPFQEIDALQNAHSETEGNFQYKRGNHFKSVVHIVDQIAKQVRSMNW